MTAYLLVVSCFVAGILLQTNGVLRDRLTATLNNFAIYIALPAIILAKVPQLNLAPSAIFVVISAWMSMALSCLIIVPLGRKLGWEREVIIVCVVLTGLGNTAFLGMAMIKLLFNDELLGFAVLYDQFGSFLLLSFLLPLVLALKGAAGNHTSLLTIGKNILFFPPFVSLIIALAVPISPITEFLKLPLEWLTLSLLPLSMLIVGMQFQLKIAKNHRVPIALSLTTKMLLIPALVAITGISFGIPKEIFQATVVQSAMPPMVTPAVFLISLNLLPRLAASILSLGTLLSFVTIPTIAFLLN